LPAYLCLADISARSENWDNVLSLSNRALAIDPSVAVVHDYHAAANFQPHNLPAAEKSALRAAELDKNNTDLASTSCWLKFVKRRVTVPVRRPNYEST